MWIFWAVLTLFGFVSSLKRMTERTTERYCAMRRRRRARRARRQQQAPCAPKDMPEQPPVIYSTAPGIVPDLMPYLQRPTFALARVRARAGS